MNQQQQQEQEMERLKDNLLYEQRDKWDKICQQVDDIHKELIPKVNANTLKINTNSLKITWMTIIFVIVFTAAVGTYFKDCNKKHSPLQQPKPPVTIVTQK